MSADLLAQIAARYGVGVSPGACVTRLPMGASVRPLPVWDGKKLIEPDWQARRASERLASWKRAKAAAVPDPVVSARRARIAALHGEGLTVAQIAGDTGLGEGLIRSDLSHLSLAAHRAPNAAAHLVDAGKQRQAERLDLIRRMVAQGASEAAIGRALQLRDRTWLRGLIRSVAPDFAFVVKRRGPAPKAPRIGVSAEDRAASRAAAALKIQTATRDRLAPLLADHSFAQIAVKLGMKRNSVASAVRRLRIVGLLPPAEDGAVVAVAPAPRRNPWAERNASIIAKAQASATVEAIAGEIGCTRKAVVRILEKAGIVPVFAAQQTYHRNLSDLPDLVAKGLTAQQIADKFGRSIKAVYAMASRSGVSLRVVRAALNKGRVSANVAARRKTVAAMIRAGDTHAAMIEATGVSHATLSHDIAALGLQGKSAYGRCRPSFARSNPDLWPVVMTAYRAGRPVKAIARDMGLKWTAVRAIITAAIAAEQAAQDMRMAA